MPVSKTPYLIEADNSYKSQGSNAARTLSPLPPLPLQVEPLAADMPQKPGRVAESLGTPPAKTSKARSTSNSLQTAEMAPVIESVKNASKQVPTPADSPVTGAFTPVVGTRANTPDIPPRATTTSRSDSTTEKPALKVAPVEPADSSKGLGSSANAAAKETPVTGDSPAPVSGTISYPTSVSATPIGAQDRFFSANSASGPGEETRDMELLPSSIFEGISIMDKYPVYDEPIRESLARYHAPWDQWTDPDPLAEYGAIKGELPGRAAEETLALRETILRYTSADRECNWSNLEQAVEEFSSSTVSVDDFHAVPHHGSERYSFGLRAVHVARLVQALTQVLESLSDYFFDSYSKMFVIDHEYTFVRALAFHESREEMVAFYLILRRRCAGAIAQIKAYLRKLKKVLADKEDNESIASYNSTVPSERERMVQASPRTQIMAYLTREDYAADFTGKNALLRANVMNRLEPSSELFKPTPYVRHRHVPHVPSSPEARKERHDFFVQRRKDKELLSANPESISAYLAAQKQVSFVEPPSAPATPSIPLSAVSVAKPHAIASLPGYGKLPSISLNDDPYEPRKGVLPVSAAMIASTTARPWPDAEYKVGVVSSAAPALLSRYDQSARTSYSDFKWGERDYPSRSGTPHGSPGKPPLDPPPGGPPSGSPGGPPGPPSGFGGGPPGGPYGGPPGGPPGSGGGPPWPPSGASGGPPEPPGGPPGPPGGGAPYQYAVPYVDPTWQINNKFNLSEVPTWDGGDETLITYVRNISAMAALSDRMNDNLAKVAPIRWTGRAKKWWDNLAANDRLHYSRNWTTLLTFLRWHFMTENWVLERTKEFEEMKFRQAGHSSEHPLDFLQRRILYHSFLFPADADGAAAIARILRTQPSEWTSWLNIVATPSLAELQQTALRLQNSLESTWELHETMRKSSDSHRYGRSSSARPSYRRRSVNLAEEGDYFDSDEDNEGDHVDKEAQFAGSKSPNRRPRSVPRKRIPYPLGKTMNGIAFTRDDSRVSATPPNGVCFICTSPKHVFRDCPHHQAFQLLKEAKLVQSAIDDADEAAMSQEYVDANSPMQSSSAYGDEDSSSSESVKEAFLSESAPRPTELLISSEQALVSEGVDRLRVIPAKKSRALPAGLGSLGARALRIRARVLSLENPSIEARLDSGADITLMSEDFYSSMKELPKLKEGLRMKLYHLTGDAKVLGYLRTTMFAEATDGTIVSFELEAYVVRGMRVPLLLGEDFQSTYEIGLRRFADGRTEVHVGHDGARVIPASSSSNVNLGFEIRQAFTSQSFVRAKALRRAKARALPRVEDIPVLAESDALIAAGCVRNVKVTAHFGTKKNWLVERFIIGSDSSSLLATPTTWINTDHPYIPIANTGTRPVYVRAGEIMGYLISEDALNQFEPEAVKKLALAANVMKSMVMSTLREQDLASATTGSSHPSEESETIDEAEWGPKTAEVPPEPINGLVTDLVNLGPDIPENIKPQLFEVLRKNEAAFGINGRLGRVDARVNIPLKEGAKPVSLPMYGASPAKREVVDHQVKAWLEAEVIEPSVSPWGFPVVVVYRNGKPRLVIDYRKLNAMTIPDEFPIPRQNEIIQALSGSQVLSSFDALAGFTQLEMADEDKEKTAFRCHLGLWQFKRMPFGLRNGPSIFQRIMQNVLSPFLWIFALVYIDDIVVFSRSWEEHLVHLDKVLSAISKAGITLSPPKCFIGYSSILLLGQKVSRLGLSTHKEKVAAIHELARPTSVNDLQKFLGMVVYFSQYIPFYSFIAAPLFALLRKGVKWHWNVEHDTAWANAKAALASAPVLGHPMQGKPYRLYTDASDVALGACLQQIQPIAVADLKGTPTYDRLSKAWTAGNPPPTLFATLIKDTEESPPAASWAETLDETVVHVERVIAYWSRTFKPAERNYSATEREALAAKEALVKFQPFIEGESVILITDHAALQWARVYENANRRLAAWGAVFAAYPKLRIVHRPGRIHSNVDPLSRMPRIPPHCSPLSDDLPAIIQADDKQALAQAAEDRTSRAPAPRAAFVVSWWEDLIVKEASSIMTRKQRKLLADGESPSGEGNHRVEARSLETVETDAELAKELPHALEDQWTYPTTVTDVDGAPDDEWNDKTHLLVSMSEALIQDFVKGYLDDPAFRGKYVEEIPSPTTVITPSHFSKARNGLLYFRDADWAPRLCVPKNLVNYVLSWIHDSPDESAHAGIARFQARLQELFYWPNLLKDAQGFGETCDVCQKIKADHRKKMGALRPAHIPARPFATVSLDLITGLPPSGEEKFTAILVIVDKLTKFAIIIPTHNELNREGFAKLFVERVVNVYGLPERIIADRDKRWATDFWKSVVKHYGSTMALSSSHHPQTDGQTENLNATIEQMLRAYVAKDRTSWASWLSVLAHAYNSSVHSSTTYAPNLLLLGYHPRITTSVISPEIDPSARPYLPSQLAEEFIAEVELRRKYARDALVLAQERQARAYNKNRRPVDDINVGDLVLVNPHSLKLVETEGTGKKLVQRTIGPFEVLERINPVVYRLRLPDTYPMHPVFNIAHLKKYRASPAEYGPRTELPSTREFLASPEYEVESILGHRILGKRNGNRRQFLVRWAGYGPTEDSWVSEYDLRNAPEVKRAYLQMHNL